MTIAPPIDWGVKRQALCTWLAGALGIQVIWGRQDAPAPAYPYAVLDTIGPFPIHQDRRMVVSQGPNAKEYVVGDRSITLSIDVLISFENRAWDPDADAFAYASVAQASLSRTSTLTTLDAVGLGVAEIGAVQDRRTALDAGWISRAGFDVTILLVSLFDPGTVEPAIETVQLGAELGAAADWADLDFGLRSLVVRFCGEQRITATSGTVIAAPGTFLQIAGTYGAEDLVGFDAPSNGRLRFTDTGGTRKHRVSVAGGFTSSVAANVKVGISKNGAQPTKWTEVKVGTDRVGIAVEDLLDLSQQDYLEAWVTADAAVTVTAQSLSLIAIS